ncbi:MAG: putative response regulator, CheY [Ramlibacter sp.]|nr:putative response regulator, CheY [Ramlibacter sp.]
MTGAHPGAPLPRPRLHWARAPSISPTKARPVTPLQAYVVEDNATIRENLIGTLEELTCVKVVGTSASENDTLKWLEQNPDGWDILIVDLFLQQGSGIHLAQSISRRRPDQKLVVFSNYINANVRKRCAQLGVDAVFDKSTEIDSLVDYCAHQCFRVAQIQAQTQTQAA